MPRHVGRLLDKSSFHVNISQGEKSISDMLARSEQERRKEFCLLNIDGDGSL